MGRRALVALVAVSVIGATVAILAGAAGSGPKGTRRTASSRLPASTASSRSVASIPSARELGPPWQVATATVTYRDASRETPARGEVVGHPGRTLSTAVRWPVTGAGVPAPGVHPLVVFAHGFAARSATYASLLDDLTAAGLIVAAPELPGESSALDGTPNETDLGNEPCDLEFVAASVLRSPPNGLGGLSDRTPVVFAGHSDGATAAAAAGYQRHSCGGPAAAAVVALSVQDITIDGTGTPPVLLAVSGTADEINPVANTRLLWSHAPAPAWLLTVDGGDHLETFTTDPDRPRVAAVIAAFVRAHTVDPAAAGALDAGGSARLHLESR